MKTDASICLIAKNEGPYLLEWIAYYSIIGFDSFLIYDNESQDDSASKIRSASRYFNIKYNFWPDTPDVSPQISAYEHAIKNTDSHWIAFIDTDEFIYIEDNKDISDFLSKFSDEIGAVCINWKLFGSSGHEKMTDDFVIRRFTKCEEHLSSHVKSIVRRDAVEKMTVHAPVLKEGMRYAYSDGTIAELQRFSEAEVHEPQPAHINHYVLKSREEYERKIIRGQGGTPTNSPDKRKKFTPGFWNAHDRNEATDTSMLSYIPEIERIVNMINES